MSESFNPFMKQLNQTPKPNQIELVPMDEPTRESAVHFGGELNADLMAKKKAQETQKGAVSTLTEEQIKKAASAPDFGFADYEGTKVNVVPGKVSADPYSSRVSQEEADRIAKLTENTRVSKLELVPKDEQGNTLQ